MREEEKKDADVAIRLNYSLRLAPVDGAFSFRCETAACWMHALRQRFCFFFDRRGMIDRWIFFRYVAAETSFLPISVFQPPSREVVMCLVIV